LLKACGILRSIVECTLDISENQKLKYIMIHDIYFVLYSKFGVFGISQRVFRCDKVSHTTMLLTITITVAKFVAGVAKIFKVGDVVPRSQ